MYKVEWFAWKMFRFSIWYIFTFIEFEYILFELFAALFHTGHGHPVVLSLSFRFSGRQSNLGMARKSALWKKNQCCGWGIALHLYFTPKINMNGTLPWGGPGGRGFYLVQIIQLPSTRPEAEYLETVLWVPSKTHACQVRRTVMTFLRNA